jgi:hypothetical protein
MPGFEIIMDARIFEEHLAEILARLQVLGSALLDIGSVVSEYMTRNFEDAPWPPLSPETIRIKEEQGFPFDPLVRTGDMKGAASSGAWAVSRAGRGWVAKLEVPGYSNFHFEGTKFMPRRDYALLPDSIEGDVVGILEAHLFEGMGG